MTDFKTLTDLKLIGKNAGPVPVVAIAGADDEAALGVVREAGKTGIRFVLTGDSRAIMEKAAETETDVSDCRIEDTGPDDEAAACSRAAALCVSGEAGVLMKGHVGTAAFSRAILNRESGLTPEGALLSHTGLFEDPRRIANRVNRPFLVTDAAININPDAETKKVILANAVSVARSLGIAAPRIALLAPVEKVSARIQSTTDAELLKEWIGGGGLGDAVADGPFALDVAASAQAASVKGLDSPVAGRADIYLAPNLDAGNVLYKALTVFAGARGAGILAGARVPVVLTSRSDGMEVKLASLALALNVAGGRPGKD